MRNTALLCASIALTILCWGLYGQVLLKGQLKMAESAAEGIALCTLLVTASLVAARGMQHSLHAPIGFEPQGAMLASTDMQMAGYSDKDSLAIQKRMLERTLGVPGVTAAGIINYTPLSGSGNSTGFYREGTTEFTPSHVALGAKYFSISPGYLKAAGTRLIAGRDVTWQDNAGSPKIALVSEIFARQLFGSANNL